MKRSFYAIAMSLVIGAFLLPATARAQSNHDAAAVSPIGHVNACETGQRVKHSFTIKLKDQVSSLLNKIKSAITGQGGSFEGNKEHGFFQTKSVLGLVKGEYRSISDKEVEITINHKPLIVSYSKIESEIKKYLS